MDHRFKGQVPLVGLKEPPISLSFKYVFVVLGLRVNLHLRIEGYQILVFFQVFAAGVCDLFGYGSLGELDLFYEKIEGHEF